MDNLADLRRSSCGFSASEMRIGGPTTARQTAFQAFVTFWQMSEPTATALRILQRYRTSSTGPFPTSEMKVVVPHDFDERADFHVRLDLYWADVAGYASDATRLNRRGHEALVKAREFLSKGFFERYPEHSHLQARVNAIDTPGIFREMEAAELNRLDLLDEVTRLLGLSENPGDV